MDYTTLVHTIVDPFLANPDAILVREIKEEETENDISLLVVAQNGDIARLIGKKGCVANAVRDIVAIAGKLENKRVHLKFESFDDEKKGE